MSVLKKSLRKTLLLTWVILWFFLVFFSVKNISLAAQQPDAFIVEVEPSSFDVWESVDLTVKAVTANGDIVKDYQWDVFIEVDGIVDSADYVVPSDGLYTFLPQDQGVKLFSKWLSIKKQWVFNIKISDIINESIEWEKSVVVWTVHNNSDLGNVDILIPVNDGIEKNDVINIMWSAPTLKNSPFEIYFNDIATYQWTTDLNWDFNVYATGVQEWENVLKVKIIDANNEIIGESDSITFIYDPISDGFFNSIQVLPSNKIKQWEIATFNLSTSDSVTSAEIRLSNWRTAPMDKKSDWSFQKQIAIDTSGNVVVSVNLMAGWSKKQYTWVTTLIVQPNISIGKIRMFADTIDKTKLNITWETIWDAPQYKISYGTGEDSLDQYVNVDTNEILIENLTIGKKYYFKIYPLDSNSQETWTPSDVVEAVIWEELACVVKGIIVSDQQIGEKHYLVWSGVVNADKYIIYRSEWETSSTSSMQKVWETTWTMFEYPFNKFSKNNEYAYYVVEALCKDGNYVKIDNARRIQVWPAENIMLFIVISLFIYSIYRLYKYSKD